MKELKKFKFIVNNLAIKTIIGCNSAERKRKKTIFLTYTYKLKKNPVVLNDDLTNTLNYQTLAHALKTNLEKESFYLIETIAEKALEIILGFPEIKKATVKIVKPKPFREVTSVDVKLSGKNK